MAVKIVHTRYSMSTRDDAYRFVIDDLTRLREEYDRAIALLENLSPDRHPGTYDVSRSEMAAILRDRVKRVYGMSLIEYARARRRRALPDGPGTAALEVFAGDFARRR